MARPDGPKLPLHREAGKGFLGFLVALVVVVYLGMFLKESFAVTKRHEEMLRHVEEALEKATRTQLETDVVRQSILQKAKELGIELGKKDLDVSRDQERWRVHLEWDDEIVIPGFNLPRHYEIDKSWTTYQR